MNIDEMKDRIARAEEIQRYTENRCESLEKENAELKAFKDKCKFNVSDICKDIETEKQLTKAKEIIREYMKATESWNYDFAEVLKCNNKAEQFLNGKNIILEDAQVGNSPFDADEVFNKEMKAYTKEY